LTGTGLVTRVCAPLTDPVQEQAFASSAHANRRWAGGKRVIRVGRALAVAIWLTAALVLYDIARVSLGSIRPQELSAHVREVAQSGVSIYGTGALLLIALSWVTILLLSSRRKETVPDGDREFSLLGGTAVFAGIIAFCVAAFGERDSGPQWPGAAWFLDFILMSLCAVAAGWMAARLLRNAARARAWPRIMALAAAPLVPALLLGAQALRAAMIPAPAPRLPAAGDGLPDLLLVVADSLRADALSCYGGDARTPTIDALAARGARLLDAWTTSPSGPPAAASLFTSRVPSDNGVTWQEARLHDGVATLAGVLHARGYRTAAFVGNPVLGARQGIDSGFDIWDDSVDARLMARDPEMLSSRIAAAIGVRRRRAWPAAREMVNRTLRDLAEPSTRPRFTYLHLGDPHDPYMPPADLLAAVNASERSRLRFGPGTLSSILRGEITLTEDDLHRVRALYRAEVEGLDRELGRLIASLRSRIESGRTIVVFLSNHGEEMMDHGSMGHGATLFEEMLRVPVIFSGAKGLPAGATLDAPASILDVAPTILELMGLPPEPRFEGRGLLRALAGDGLPPPPGAPIASQMDSVGYHTPWHWARAARRGSTKVVVSSTDVLGIDPWRSETFDLAADPAERNAAGTSGGGSDAAELEAWLREWIGREKHAAPATARAAGGAGEGASANGL